MGFYVEPVAASFSGHMLVMWGHLCHLCQPRALWATSVVWFGGSDLTHTELVHVLMSASHSCSRQFNQSVINEAADAGSMLFYSVGCVSQPCNWEWKHEREHCSVFWTVFCSFYCSSLSLNSSATAMSFSTLHLTIFFNYTSAPFTFQCCLGAPSVISAHICFVDDSFHRSAEACTGPMVEEVCIFSDY